VQRLSVDVASGLGLGLGLSGQGQGKRVRVRDSIPARLLTVGLASGTLAMVPILTHHTTGNN
jgi:hypothetical protein